MWLVLWPANKSDWMWYVTGGILILAPFVYFGGSWDFMMRSTIPALYILALGCARFLVTGKRGLASVLLVFMLIAGMITPIYEINRSVVRTVAYHDPRFLSFIGLDQYFQHAPATAFVFVPEFDHPQTLTADEWITLAAPRGDAWNMKVGTLFDPALQFLWKSELVLYQ